MRPKVFEGDNNQIAITRYIAWTAGYPAMFTNPTPTNPALGPAMTNTLMIVNFKMPVEDTPRLYCNSSSDIDNSAIPRGNVGDYDDNEENNHDAFHNTAILGRTSLGVENPTLEGRTETPLSAPYQGSSRNIERCEKCVIGSYASPNGARRVTESCTTLQNAGPLQSIREERKPYIAHGVSCDNICSPVLLVEPYRNHVAFGNCAG